MKKHLRKIGSIILCATLVSGLFHCDVHASSSVYRYKFYENSKVFYENIDGKKGKEKIYIKRIERSDGYYDYYVYINGVKVHTIQQNQGYCFCIIDIQKNKKGKEIILGGISNRFVGDSFGIYQYKNKKLKKIGSNRYGYWTIGTAPYEVKTDGKGKVTFVTEGETQLGIGSYTSSFTTKLVKGKLKVTNAKELKIKDVATYTGKDLVLAKKTKVYKKASTKSKVTNTIKVGSSVKIKKVKIGKFVKNHAYRSYDAKDVYAYVHYGKGKKGWIKIKKNLFKELVYCG